MTPSVLNKLLVTLLLAAGLCQAMNLQNKTVPLDGLANPVDRHECVLGNHIDKVELRCPNAGYIHISRLLFTSSLTCTGGSQCDWRSPLHAADACEGRQSICSFAVQHHRDNPCSNMATAINQINITFQCIEGRKIHSMCPTSKTSTYFSENQPAYYETPSFTVRGKTYQNSMQCNCDADAEPGYSFNYKFLYLDLEVRSGYSCYDGITFGNMRGAYCKKSNLLESPVNGSFNQGSWTFKTDSSNAEDGSWIKIFSQPANGTMNITCETTQLLTTSTTRTTPYRTTRRPYWARTTTTRRPYWARTTTTRRPYWVRTTLFRRVRFSNRRTTAYWSRTTVVPIFGDTLRVITNIPAIVGGTIGGMFLLACIGAVIGIFVWRKKQRKTKAAAYIPRLPQAYPPPIEFKMVRNAQLNEMQQAAPIVTVSSGAAEQTPILGSGEEMRDHDTPPPDYN